MIRHIKAWRITIQIAVATLLLIGNFATATEQKRLKVGVAGSAPFVINNGDELHGISIKVWESVAMDNNLQYDYFPHRSVDIDKAIDSVDKGEIDLLIGPISITSQRLKIPGVNFTQPYFFAKAGVLLHKTPPTLFDRVKVFFGKAVLSSVVVLISVIFTVGTLIWLAERRRNEDNFPREWASGIANGAWFALVTLTTVGYGDKAPITRTGRLITSTWMVISLIAVSSLTAGLASALTLFLSGASESPIHHPEDLKQRRVAVVKGSSGSQIAEDADVILVVAETLDDAVQLVLNNDAAAFIFDRPALRYYLKNHPDLPLKIAPFTLAEETYGFAFKTGSHLNTPLDVSILELQRTGAVETLTTSLLTKDQPTD